jgi:hypothetical protein
LRQDDCEFENSLGYIARPCFKIKRKKKIAGVITQVVKHLPSKFKVLSSNPRIALPHKITVFI